MTTKTFASRDSATSALRKLGIKPADYNQFIAKTTDGKFDCAIDSAKQFIDRKTPSGDGFVDAMAETVQLKDLAKTDHPIAKANKESWPSGKKPKAEKTFGKQLQAKIKDIFTEPKAKVQKAPFKSADRRSVSSAARELIVAGKTNEEVWKALQKEFDLPDSKKSYAAWYRADCKRKSLI